jgi:long-chain acyl-CoA synthetase
MGAIAVPVYQGLRGRELAYTINKVEPRVLVTTTHLFSYFEKIQTDVSPIAHLYLTDQLQGDHAFSVLCKPQVFTIPDISGDAVAGLFFTSGSTGAPKGAAHTYYGITEAYMATSHATDILEDERVMVSNIDFNASLFAVLLPAIYLGVRLCLVPTPTPREAYDAIIKHKITRLFRVPSHWAQIIDIAKHEKKPHSLVRCSAGGDVVTEELHDAFEQTFGIPLTSGMGMTETGFQSFVPDAKGQKRLSVGLPLPNVEVKVIDKKGAVMPANMAGELLIKSTSMMKGYWRDGEKTKQVLIDGWMHSGDICRIDDEGYIWFVDRSKNMIIVDGDNFAPSEVERILMQYPGITNAVVVGVPNDFSNNDAVAFVEKNTHGPVDPHVLIEHCRNELADFKVPTAVHFVKAFPKNARGKIDRKQLIENARSL